MPRAPLLPSPSAAPIFIVAPTLANGLIPSPQSIPLGQLSPLLECETETLQLDSPVRPVDPTCKPGLMPRPNLPSSMVLITPTQPSPPTPTAAYRGSPIPAVEKRQPLLELPSNVESRSSQQLAAQEQQQQKQNAARPALLPTPSSNTLAVGRQYKWVASPSHDAQRKLCLHLSSSQSQVKSSRHWHGSRSVPGSASVSPAAVQLPSTPHSVCVNPAASADPTKVVSNPVSDWQQVTSTSRRRKKSSNVRNNAPSLPPAPPLKADGQFTEAALSALQADSELVNIIACSSPTAVSSLMGLLNRHTGCKDLSGADAGLLANMLSRVSVDAKKQALTCSPAADSRESDSDSSASAEQT